jgi:catechol 2,3-dioxygenase-like lactoylglutathione lyase family enzyme
MSEGVDFVYSGIRVRDLARSIRFYRRLGFTVVQRGSFSHGGRYVHLALPGSTHRLELNFYPRGSRFYEPFLKGAGFDHFGFSSTDPEAWLASARRAGAKFLLGYEDRPAQQLYFVRDPDGVWLGVFGPRSDATSKRLKSGSGPRTSATRRRRPLRRAVAG